MASAEENAKFFPDILGCVQYPLDAVIDWLKDNKGPEDVFTEIRGTDINTTAPP